MILMGDVDLCMNKWKDPTYTHKDLANEILETLALMTELGPTYLGDRL